MKQLTSIFIAAFLLSASFAEAKRTLGRGTSSRPSGNSNTRRVSATSRPYQATSRPIQATSRPIQSSHTQNTNAHNSQNIGWNSQNKPVGPPPAYSPVNPAGGAKPNLHAAPPSYNAPPSYSGNTGVRTPTIRPAVPGNSYPHNSAVPANVGQPKYYAPNNAPSVGYHPAGSVGAGGYHPQTGGYQPQGGGYHAPSYYPAGSMGAGYHPQSPPVYAGAGVQPGYYPAGSFPQRSSSGLGFGSGLAAGAIGGAILGHVLTPSGSSSYGHSGNMGNNGNSDRVIVINNTPGQPAQVTTADGNQPIVINNGQPAPVAAPEAPVPLAPYQPGTTQVQGPPPNPEVPPVQGPTITPPLIHNANPNQNYPEGTVPLAPMGPTEAPKGGGVMCYPVLVNITSETDPTNITTVEQIACYEVPADFDPNAPQQTNNSSVLNSSQPPDLMHMPGAGITQKTSTATLAESSQIKQSGAVGYYSEWTTITSTLAALFVAYCLQ